MNWKCERCGTVNATEICSHCGHRCPKGLLSYFEQLKNQMDHIPGAVNTAAPRQNTENEYGYRTLRPRESSSEMFSVKSRARSQDTSFGEELLKQIKKEMNPVSTEDVQIEDTFETEETIEPIEIIEDNEVTEQTSVDDFSTDNTTVEEEACEVQEEVSDDTVLAEMRDVTPTDNKIVASVNDDEMAVNATETEQQPTDSETKTIEENKENPAEEFTKPEVEDVIEESVSEMSEQVSHDNVSADSDDDISERESIALSEEKETNNTVSEEKSKDEQEKNIKDHKNEKKSDQAEKKVEIPQQNKNNHSASKGVKEKSKPVAPSKKKINKTDVQPKTPMPQKIKTENVTEKKQQTKKQSVVTPVTFKKTKNEKNTEPKKTNTSSNNQKRNKAILVGVVVALLLVVACVAYVLYPFGTNTVNKNTSDITATEDSMDKMFADGEIETDNADETEDVAQPVADAPLVNTTDEVTATPSVAPKPVDTIGDAAEKKQSVPRAVNCKTYTNETYGFHCPYPAAFMDVPNDDEGICIAMAATDQSASMRVYAFPNDGTLTTEDALEEYLSSLNGEKEYRANGNTWYAGASVKDNHCYYRKCFINQHGIYYFDFDYDLAKKDRYDPYIEYIEDHFKRNK